MRYVSQEYTAQEKKSTQVTVFFITCVLNVNHSFKLYYTKYTHQ